MTRILYMILLWNELQTSNHQHFKPDYIPRKSSYAFPPKMNGELVNFPTLSTPIFASRCYYINNNNNSQHFSACTNYKFKWSLLIYTKPIQIMIIEIEIIHIKSKHPIRTHHLVAHLDLVGIHRNSINPYYF